MPGLAALLREIFVIGSESESVLLRWAVRCYRRLVLTRIKRMYQIGLVWYIDSGAAAGLPSLRAAESADRAGHGGGQGGPGNIHPEL